MKSSTYQISIDKEKLDVPLICSFLQKSYWASKRTSDQIIKSIRHSMCFGVYAGDDQVGFARVISDFSTFAYIADVFIVESKRGCGLGSELMQAMLSHPDVREVPNWYVITKDAQGLYKKFNFNAYDDAEKTTMIMKRNFTQHEQY